MVTADRRRCLIDAEPIRHFRPRRRLDSPQLDSVVSDCDARNERNSVIGIRALSSIHNHSEINPLWVRLCVVSVGAPSFSLYIKKKEKPKKNKHIFHKALGMDSLHGKGRIERMVGGGGGGGINIHERRFVRFETGPESLMMPASEPICYPASHTPRVSFFFVFIPFFFSP